MILEIDTLVLDYGVKMTIINISKKIENAFINHGEKEYPHECCGFIIGNFKGNDSFGLKYLPAANIKEENRERRFLIDPQAYQKAEDEADAQGLSVISIVHSHPDHPDKPSEFDRNHAWPGFSYIIISIQNGKAKSYKSWQLQQDRKSFIEEKINIVKEG